MVVLRKQRMPLSKAMEQQLLPLIVDEEKRALLSAKATLSYERHLLIAWNEEQVVGFLLWESSRLQGLGLLLYIVVIPEWQRQGVAGRLIKRAMALMPRAGVRLCQAIYEEGRCPALPDLMVKQGWSPPALEMVRCHFDGFTFAAPWLGVRPPMPKGYKIFFWSDLTKEQRDQVKHIVAQRGISPILSPLRYEDSLASINSLGISYRNEIVAWVICRHKDDAIYYASLWVDPLLRGGRLALRLMADSINLQRQSDQRHAVIEVNWHSEITWRRLVEKTIMPHSSLVEKFYACQWVPKE